MLGGVSIDAMLENTRIKQVGGLDFTLCMMRYPNPFFSIPNKPGQPGILLVASKDVRLNYTNERASASNGWYEGWGTK